MLINKEIIQTEKGKLKMKFLKFFMVGLFFSFNCDFLRGSNICPAQGTIRGASTDIMTTTSIDISSFVGPFELSSDINFNVYHKVVNDERIHLVLESQDTQNRWLGFGFAEQQSGHMKGKFIIFKKLFPSFFSFLKLK